MSEKNTITVWIDGKVTNLSGYESDLYNDILCDWHKETTECYDQASNKKKEVVWMNFEPQRDQQMSFIDGCERLCST